MKEKQEKPSSMNRRDFLKIVGISAATSTGILYGCNTKTEEKTNHITTQKEGSMTYRVSPKSNDKVSLLGYGCMRWPTLPSPDGNGNVIDQDAVNNLVDYAIAHGVNYFDTSPVYVQGWSEKSTGIALKRHPRNKYFIATKLSNFSNWTKENSIAMYKQSFKDLQTDISTTIYCILSGMEA